MPGLLGRILLTGTAAAIGSAITAACWGRLERGRTTAPLNAISHIAWDSEPPGEVGPGGINLATGLALHAGASLFWATPFELLFGRSARRSALAAWLGGAIVSGVAFVTDYYVVSRRFRPGYEAYLSPRGLFAVYAALAASLAIGARSTRFDDHQPEDRHEGDERRHAQPGPDRVIPPESGWQDAAGSRRLAGERRHANLDPDDREPAGGR
jgi:hypothetical protein